LRRVNKIRRNAPWLNHVAISMPPAALDDAGRAAIEAFYGDVFGWWHAPTDEPGDPLVLATGAKGQFVYLHPADPSMVTPELDHFGVQVETVAELDEILERARAFETRDDRVRIIEKKSATNPSRWGPVTLTNCYVGYLLPMMVEIQHHEYPPGMFGDAG
jgi:hypothetical protein